MGHGIWGLLMEYMMRLTVPILLLLTANCTSNGLNSSAPASDDTVRAEGSAAAHFMKTLGVDRRGDTPNSNMTTLAFEQTVEKGSTYRFVSGRGIVAAPGEVAREMVASDIVPSGLKFATLDADWDSAVGVADDSNILGGNGTFTIHSDDVEFSIPIVEATEEALRYFGAHLLRDGDCFEFNATGQFPIFTMEVGVNYVRDCVMAKGKGLYLEHHNEPHYHEPLDSDAGGVYLLAKRVTSEVGRSQYRVVGFRIPPGHAVYSEPGAIHDDGTVTGRWRVGYTKAELFSTAVIKNRAGVLANFVFSP